MVANRQQRADQRGKWQHAPPGEGSGEVGISDGLRDVAGGDSVGKFMCKELFKFKGDPVRKSTDSALSKPPQLKSS